MTDPSIFDPRNPLHKSPYGAVPAGTRVQFTLHPPRSAGFSGAKISARFEFLSDLLVKQELPWVGLEGSNDLFSGNLDTGNYIGLVWYHIELERVDGTALTLGEYQLTVYDPAQSVPAWFGRGMSYQIFPDRFRRLAVPSPEGLVGSRWVHESWADEPAYRPDEHGEIRNRDFFGGTLAGVMEKLDYIHGLGVDTIYFCPLFEGAENHRYGTGDYEKIDPMLGTNEEFTALCAAAHARGMRVMIDGVFNHTGFVSKYFNGDGSYDSLGAHQSQQSPYYNWFTFSNWPNKYDAWWGIYSLPNVNEQSREYIDYITGSETSIVRRWLRAGADAWRLDVADELPDDFIHALHHAARETKKDAFVLGEVWEDGTNKIAYGVRRRHLLGGHLDGVMNYPFRTAVLRWILEEDAAFFREEMELLRENYPPAAFYAGMNSLGTHDTPRIFTLLGVGSDCKSATRDARAEARMNAQQRELGAKRLRIASLVQFAFPGSPTVYYGDEAGMEGFEDPFNRRTFPWGTEDLALTDFFRALGMLRKTLLPLRRGDIAYLCAAGALLAFTRSWAGETVLCAANAGGEDAILPVPGSWTDSLSGETVEADEETGEAVISLPALSGRILQKVTPA